MRYLTFPLNYVSCKTHHRDIYRATQRPRRVSEPRWYCKIPLRTLTVLNHKSVQPTFPTQSDTHRGSEIAEPANNPSDDESDQTASLVRRLQELKEQQARKKEMKRESRDRENNGKKKKIEVKLKVLEDRLEMGQAEVEGFENEYQSYKRLHENDKHEIQQALRKKQAELHDYIMFIPVFPD